MKNAVKEGEVCFSHRRSVSPPERPARHRPRVLVSHVPEVVGVKLAKVAVAVLFLAAAVAAVRASGLGDLLSPRNLGLLGEYVEDFGVLAPLAYVLAYAAATVFFLHATPLTLLAGLAFGPAWGSLYAFLGATAGLTL